ncbi:G-D-S-L family lipolytic protein [Sphingobacterium corticibacter]|uniref:G-D-S-L family lipolytic protein n=2 Tax=Sphingobacterium corticibacter TaxID=2171749 RepID=A0A2T8HL47_9SPHI|nr:G-D-S-L family lipolytic protein [Sphingobacterium corticibacter]
MVNQTIMKKIFNIYTSAFFGLFFVASCSPSLDEFEVRNTSTADFNKYIAIGNSLTAGFADGGLYLSGQQVAFPNLIAAQMQSVGGGTFTSPFFNANQANGSGYLRLDSLVNGRPVTAPVTDNLAIRGLNPNNQPLYTKYEGPEINNYGVPGMRLDLAFAPGVGSPLGNPYFERLLGDNDVQTTYFGYTIVRQHTFFSFWLGNNDVLGYAMNGAVGGTATTTLTDAAVFSALYNRYIDSLTTNDRKGVIATIPDVTSIPFFTTVTQPQLAAAVTEGTRGTPLETDNVLIQTKTGIRLATPEDLFFLTFPRERIEKEGLGIDPRNPIPDNMVLDRDEVAEVLARVQQYNNVIRQVAERRDLALVDVHAFLAQARTGFIYNGIPFSSSFITGNAFSLDGIHLTPIGNAVIANLFIDEINRKYNATIPRVDVTRYRGVQLPNHN